MKTTEMFIEQILIGGTLLVVILLLLPEKAQEWKPDGPLSSVIFGTTALGAAYLLGTAYDRFADTLLEDQEKRARLRYGLERYDLGKADIEDIFPESWYLVLVLTAGEGVTERATYLRSRLRLLRDLTTLLPAMAVSFSLWQIWDMKFREFFVVRNIVIFVLAFVYGGVFLYKTLKIYKAPKTYPEKNRTPLDQINKIKEHLEINWFWRDPVYIGLGLLMVVTGFLQAIVHGMLFWLLPIVTLTATLLCGWCFLRIQRTYISFLDHYHEHWEREKRSSTGK